MKKRMIALLIAVLLVVGMFLAGALAAGTKFDDVSGHWRELYRQVERI